jgi:hypothetical protein
MDGSSYQWGTTFFSWHFGGRGISADYWLLIVKVVLAIALLYFGWRRPSARTAAALAGWQILFAADTAYYAITDPRGFRFRGDTLGVDISLTWIAPTLATAFAIIAVWWVRELSRRPVITLPVGPDTRSIDTRLWMAVAIIPVQLILLHHGRGTDRYDVGGVVLTILQWLLVSLALRARSPVKHRDLVANQH